MPPGENQGLRRRRLLRRERRGLKGEEGAVGGRAVPAGRHQEAATEPGGSFSLVSSPRESRSPSGLRSVSPIWACRGGSGGSCMLGWGCLKDTTFLSSSLLGPLALHSSSHPRGPSMQGDPQVAADVGHGVRQGSGDHSLHRCNTHAHAHMRVVRGTAYYSSQMSAPAWESVPRRQQPQVYHSECDTSFPSPLSEPQFPHVKRGQ